MKKHTIKINDSHRAYMTRLADRPQPPPEYWPQYMVEMHSAGLIMKAGSNIHLTERGWEIATTIGVC